MIMSVAGALGGRGGFSGIAVDSFLGRGIVEEICFRFQVGGGLGRCGKRQERPTYFYMSQGEARLGYVGLSLLRYYTYHLGNCVFTHTGRTFQLVTGSMYIIRITKLIACLHIQISCFG